MQRNSAPKKHMLGKAALQPGRSGQAGAVLDGLGHDSLIPANAEQHLERLSRAVPAVSLFVQAYQLRFVLRKPSAADMVDEPELRALIALFSPARS